MGVSSKEKTHSNEQNTKTHQSTLLMSHVDGSKNAHDAF